MPLAMILDVMTAAHDFPREVRMALDAFADAKEGGDRPVLPQLRQYVRRYIGVRAVVDGNGDRARFAAVRR